MEVGLTNIYLQRLCAKLIPRVFLDVFSCDDLLKLPSGIGSDRPRIVIVNFSRRDEKGTHFVAMEISKQGIIYFDSLGLPATIDANIAAFAKKQGHGFTETWTVPVQHMKSTFCGYYCVAFACARSMEWTIGDFYRNFINLPSIQNDQKAVEIILMYIKEKMNKKSK